MSNTELPDRLTVDITSLAHGGHGIARVNGRVIFIRKGVPGDRDVEVVVDKKKSTKGLIWADIASIGSPSPQRGRGRGNLRCEAAEQGAGCCDFLHVDPVHAATPKSEIVKDQFSRIGHLEITPSAVQLKPSTGWRTRMRLAVDGQGNPGLRKAHSHDIVSGYPCIQAAEGLLGGLEDTKFQPHSEVIVALDSRGERHVAQISPAQLDKTAGTLSGKSRKRNKYSRQGRNVARKNSGRKTVTILEGSGVCTEQLGERTFFVPATGFWQAHTTAAHYYRTAIAELLPTFTNGVAWDLYGGVGLFADVLAAKVPGGYVDSVELDPDAKVWGEKSLGNSNSRINFVTAAVGTKWDQLHTNAAGGADIILVDPPRAGMGEKLIQQVANYRPQAVVHIACDPASGARDIGAWASCGYAVENVIVVDAFPGTHHMETIVLLKPR